MSRHEGDPVPHVHQFYRATLQGLFSLDMRASGTFSYREKTGYRNLDDERVKLAKERGLAEVKGEKAYRLPMNERLERVSALLDSIAQVQGGAKLTLHYTDVAPVVTVVAVTKGGNHIFGHVVGATPQGEPTLKLEALAEALQVFADEILSPVYVGWVKGYRDEERAKLEAFAAEPSRPIKVIISHPRDAFRALIADLQQAENQHWMD